MNGLIFIHLLAIVRQRALSLKKVGRPGGGKKFLTSKYKAMSSKSRFHFLSRQSKENQRIAMPKKDEENMKKMHQERLNLNEHQIELDTRNILHPCHIDSFICYEHTLHDPQENAYSVRMYHYFQAPKGDVYFDRYCNATMNRLRLLTTIHYVNLLGFTKLSSRWICEIKRRLQSDKLNEFVRLINNTSTVADRRMDHYTYFALKLPFCVDEEHWQWLCEQELLYVQLKLHHARVSMPDFYALHGMTLKLQPIEDRLKMELRNELLQSSKGLKERDFEKTTFYKFRFLFYHHLIKRRLVLLKDGYVYIHDRYHYLIYSNAVVKRDIESGFEIAQQINRYLASSKLKRLSFLLLEEHARFEPPKPKHEPNFTSNHIITDVEDLVTHSHMPLCMLNTHRTLNNTGTIKHIGRMQLWTYLRDIGLPFDALLKYAQEFIEVFHSEYLYYLQHMYSLVGRRQGASASNCSQIINKSVDKNIDYGCPFRIFSPGSLSVIMGDMGLTDEEIEKVLDQVNQRQYTAACSAYFSAQHNCGRIRITHPNEYTKLSLEYKGTRLKTDNNTTLDITFLSEEELMFMDEQILARNYLVQTYKNTEES